MAVDKPAGAGTAHAPAQPGKWRLGGALWLLGMPGVVAVVWALLPTLKVNEALLPLPLEAVLLLTTIVQKCRIEPSDLREVRLFPSATLRPRDGVHLRLGLREAHGAARRSEPEGDVKVSEAHRRS